MSRTNTMILCKGEVASGVRRQKSLCLTIRHSVQVLKAAVYLRNTSSHEHCKPEPLFISIHVPVQLQMHVTIHVRRSTELRLDDASAQATRSSMISLTREEFVQIPRPEYNSLAVTLLSLPGMTKGTLLQSAQDVSSCRPGCGQDRCRKDYALPVPGHRQAIVGLSLRAVVESECHK